MYEIVDESIDAYEATTPYELRNALIRSGSCMIRYELYGAPSLAQHHEICRGDTNDVVVFRGEWLTLTRTVGCPIGWHRA